MGDTDPGVLDATITDLVDDYLREQILRPATKTLYTKIARLWVRDTGVADIRKVTRNSVVEWRSDILQRARPETWNRNRRHLRALFNHAVSKGWAEENPFSLTPPARTEDELRKTVDTELIARALSRLDADDSAFPAPAWFWAVVVRTYFFTGVRRRQLVDVRWCDIDLSRSTWHIRAETSKTRRAWTLPLIPVVRRDLEYLYLRTVAQSGDPPAPVAQVFNVTLFNPRYKGSLLTVQQVNGFFQRLSRILGEPITPHRLRHTMATELAVKGDLRTLQQILGHTNISTTLRYVHPDLERMRGLLSGLPSL